MRCSRLPDVDRAPPLIKMIKYRITAKDSKVTLPRRSECLLVEVRAINNCKGLTEFPRIKGVVKRILVSKLPVKDKCQWIVQTHRHIFSLEAQADCGRLHDVFHVTDIVPCQCMLFMLLMGCINIHARDAIALYFAPAWMVKRRAVCKICMLNRWSDFCDPYLVDSAGSAFSVFLHRCLPSSFSFLSFSVSVLYYV